MAKSELYFSPSVEVAEVVHAAALCTTSDYTGNAGDDWTYNDIGDEL